MSEYMLAPGARLEIGPGGKPYESLGACCSACAQGAPTCAGALAGPPARKDGLSTSAHPTVRPMTSAAPAPSSSRLPYYLAAAGAGVALFLYLRRR